MDALGNVIDTSSHICGGYPDTGKYVLDIPFDARLPVRITEPPLTSSMQVTLVGGNDYYCNVVDWGEYGEEPNATIRCYSATTGKPAPFPASFFFTYQTNRIGTGAFCPG